MSERVVVPKTSQYGTLAYYDTEPAPAWWVEEDGTLGLRCICRQGAHFPSDRYTVDKDGNVEPAIYHWDCWEAHIQLKDWIPIEKYLPK